MPEQPEITVLMPAYNAEKYIGAAISSVLGQSFANFELLVVNDGSTDGTKAIVNSFSDPRIVMIAQSNRGVAAALNTGLQHARAPYIARFDADDICYPNRLEVQYQFLKSNPQYGMVGSAVDYITHDGEFLFTYLPAWLSSEQIQKLDLTICPFIHSSVFYRKDLVTAIGGYDQNAYSFEDHLLWTSMLRYTATCNLPESLIKVRFNPESITMDEKWRGRRFREIKYQALKTRTITAEMGSELKAIGARQNQQMVNYSAYHGMLAKKFLWNNHNPVRARENIKKAVSFNAFDWRIYVLFLLTFLPEKALVWLYGTVKSETIILPRLRNGK